MEYERGPRRNGVAVSTKGPRFTTPWGTLPLGQERFTLRTPAGELVIGVEIPPRSWVSRVTRVVERLFHDPLTTSGEIVTHLLRKISLG